MDTNNIKDSLNDDDFMNPYEGDEVVFDPFVIKEIKQKPSKKKAAKSKAEGQLTIEELLSGS